MVLILRLIKRRITLTRRVTILSPQTLVSPQVSPEKYPVSERNQKLPGRYRIQCTGQMERLATLLGCRPSGSWGLLRLWTHCPVVDVDVVNRAGEERAWGETLSNGIGLCLSL